MPNDTSDVKDTQPRPIQHRENDLAVDEVSFDAEKQQSTQDPTASQWVTGIKLWFVSLLQHASHAIPLR